MLNGKPKPAREASLKIKLGQEAYMKGCEGFRGLLSIWAGREDELNKKAFYLLMSGFGFSSNQKDWRREWQLILDKI